MAWLKGLTLDPATWRKVWVDLVQAAMVSVTPGANKIPQADATGKLDVGWVPALGISQLPVAADGEVSATKVVVADDSRLGNPPVGGDLSGTAASATVAKLRGRAVATTAPAEGQVLTWDTTAQEYQPRTPTTGSSLTVGESDGTPSVAGVTTIRVADGTLTDHGGGVVTLATGGGGGSGRSAATRLFLHGNCR